MKVLAIIDMQKELNNSTQALGKAVASERIAKKQYDQAAAKSADWESKAKTAIAAGDEELAKKALANKVKADKDTAQYKEMYDTISQQTETIRTQVEVLKKKPSGNAHCTFPNGGYSESSCQCDRRV